jgi:integrase
MTLKDLFENLYRPLRLRGRSQATTRLYGCVIRNFGRWLGREPEVRDLDELVLAQYLEARASQVAPLTVERERCSLVALASLAWERRLIEMKPTCPPGHIPDRVPTAWSVEELRAVMAAASDPATFCGLPKGRPPRSTRPAVTSKRQTPRACTYARFFSAIVPTLYETGERIGAMLGAMIEDYERPYLVVRAEARKGRKRDRAYRLTEETCDRIDALIAGRDTGPVFVWDRAKQLLYRRFGQVVYAAGLDTKKRLRFHQIRRSAASHFAAAGGDAVEMLDHSSPKITKRWYLDPRLVDRGARPCDLLPSITLEPTPARPASA